jgi:hypothetical protein
MSTAVILKRSLHTAAFDLSIRFSCSHLPSQDAQAVLALAPKFLLQILGSEKQRPTVQQQTILATQR